jgi:hypothetical protein
MSVLTEGVFRLNLWPAVLALGLTASVELHWAWSLLTVLLCGALFVQSVGKYFEAESVLMRAIVQGIVRHPLDVSM